LIPSYIAFEGIDGSGKNTQLALLAQRLEIEGITPIILHEPSYGVHGRRIRAGLKSITEDVEEQRALFTADRVDHVAAKIAPALAFVRANPSFVILQNRSILSAAAYQPRGSGDRGLRETIDAELRIAPMPEVIIVLDLSVEMALDRIGESNTDSMEHPDRLEAARKRYRRLAELLPICLLIDAAGDRASVAARVYTSIQHEGYNRSLCAEVDNRT
jgi:dTMP kinase